MDKIQVIKKCIPVLDYAFHKGQYGRIGVIGGSFEYTGAPYYAGISALKMGADLCHIICTEAAAIPIKSYSPELIVHPLLSTISDPSEVLTQVIPILKRMNALVIGPGLGRHPNIMNTVSEIIAFAQTQSIPMVLDGDALYLVAQHLTLLQSDSPVILTPNAMEYARLCHSLDLIDQVDLAQADSISIPKVVEKLEHSNICIVRKGQHDQVSDGRDRIWVNSITGMPRRCGGQGDVLAGCTGVFLAWSCKNAELSIVDAAIAGSVLTRLSALAAFENHHRSTTTPDIISCIGKTFHQFFEHT